MLPIRHARLQLPGDGSGTVAHRRTRDRRVDMLFGRRRAISWRLPAASRGSGRRRSGRRPASRRAAAPAHRGVRIAAPWPSCGQAWSSAAVSCGRRSIQPRRVIPSSTRTAVGCAIPATCASSVTVVHGRSFNVSSKAAALVDTSPSAFSMASAIMTPKAPSLFDHMHRLCI